MAISPFKIIIPIILITRIILFGFPSFEIDMNLWIAWSERLVSIGPFNFYSETYFSDYFPGYLYILWVLGGIHNLIFPFSSNVLSFEILIKLVTTAFDIGTAFYIFKIIKRHQKKLALVGAALYLGNPAIIFNSSIWGQVDGVFTFFLVLAAYHLLEKRKVLKSNFYFSLAILIKPQSLALLPTVIKKNLDVDKLKAIRNLLFIPLILVGFSLPFFISNPIFGLINLGQKASEVYPYNSLFAFNFWSLFGFWESDSKTTFSISHQIWGFIIYSIFMVLILGPTFLKKIKGGLSSYLAFALSFLAFYLLLTRIHERYIFPFFAFILIAALISKSRKLFGIYVATSLIHLVNLWYVYYYYNFIFKGVVEDNFIYNILNDNYKILSLSLISIFIYLLAIYLLPALKPKIRII